MAKIKIILGLGFGDEGKGSTVNSLCGNVDDTLVIRFNGGHQVGHTVVHNNIHHAFSNYGSGTLRGVATYWSEYCTVNPVAVIREGEALKKFGIDPIVYYNANAMVTTPFDISHNRSSEIQINHGSVGVGFGATIQRNEDHYHLYVRDLQFPKIRDEKLRLLMNNYYNYNFEPEEPHQNAYTRLLYDEFIKSCDLFVKTHEIVNDLEGTGALSADKDLIFEGGQGILLDQDYGFFPHVTRSNTTSKNALKIIRNNGLETDDIKTYYVSRAYQTRHGNGYMSNVGMDTSYIKENPKETNVMGFQGEFRKTVLDLDLMSYALSCDNHHNKLSTKYLVLTCCDQIPEQVPITMSSNLHLMSPKEIAERLGLRIISSKSEKGFLYCF